MCMEGRYKNAVCMRRLDINNPPPTFRRMGISATSWHETKLHLGQSCNPLQRPKFLWKAPVISAVNPLV
jgi:hypothetical protein